MTKTKIIFMGTPDFSRVVLQGLIDSDEYEIVAVVTQPDRKVGRKQILQQSPVKELALLYNFTVFQPEKLSNSKELNEIMSLCADGIITAAFGQFLPKKMLDSVDFSINVHASLLPKYRGGAPIHYALMAGDSEIGVTLIEMVYKMDAGDMIAQKSIPVMDTDNVGIMFKKLAVVGRDLLIETLPKYLMNEIEPVKQDECKVSFSPNILSEKERIDWNRNMHEIFNQVRGMNPFPVAHTFWKGDRFKIYEVKKTEGSGISGKVISKTKKSLVVACGEGALELLVVQPAGKPKMTIDSFLNGLGREIKEGMQFGE